MLSPPLNKRPWLKSVTSIAQSNVTHFPFTRTTLIIQKQIVPLSLSRRAPVHVYTPAGRPIYLSVCILSTGIYYTALLKICLTLYNCMQITLLAARNAVTQTVNWLHIWTVCDCVRLGRVVSLVKCLGMRIDSVSICFYLFSLWRWIERRLFSLVIVMLTSIRSIDCVLRTRRYTSQNVYDNHRKTNWHI